MHIEEYPSPQVLRRHLHADRAEIIAYQNHRLRLLIEHAYESVAFYRKRFDRVGLKPEDIRSNDDLRAIPITTKNDLKAAPLKDTIAAGLAGADVKFDIELVDEISVEPGGKFRLGRSLVRSNDEGVNWGKTVKPDSVEPAKLSGD